MATSGISAQQPIAVTVEMSEATKVKNVTMASTAVQASIAATVCF